MRGLNKVMIIGSLGQDPETRYSAQGAPISNINVATNESYTDKQTNQKVEKTEWHRVVLFNRLAEIAADYLRKGSKVYIEGKLQTRKWQDQQGQDRYTTEIVANDLQMLDSRNDNGQAQQGGYQQAPQQGGYQQAPQQRQAQQGGYQQKTQPRSNPQQAPAMSGGYPDDFDDDIPF